MSFLLQLPCSGKQKPYSLAQIETVPSPVAIFLGNLINTGAKPILSHAYINKTDKRNIEMFPYYASISTTPTLQHDPVQGQEAKTMNSHCVI